MSLAPSSGPYVPTGQDAQAASQEYVPFGH